MSGSPSTAMATVVFTDLVDSTGLRAALGEERADAVRRAHDALLQQQVEAHGGWVVKGGGDGVLAAFDSASSGLAASVAMQRAIAAYNRRGDRLAALSIRVGMSAGDVSWEDGDCFGTPVVEAARLVAAAGADQILCSEYVRLMARGRGDHQLSPVGELVLKGLPEPVAAFEVDWSEGGTSGSSVLPASLAAGLEHAFVGRSAELDAARVVLDGLDRPAVGVVWVVGEPGIGKSALAAHLAADRHRDGWTVLFGRSDEALQLPYQPFAQALRDAVTGSAAVVEDLSVSVRRAMARLCPDLSEALIGGDPVAAEELAAPVDGQAQTFDAVRTWLARMAVRAPTVLVLDDLQWATDTTLLLADYVVRTVGSGRLVVVATVRDTDCPELLRSIIDESTVRTGTVTVRLGGLAVEEVEALAGVEQAAVLHARTAGNPFFVRALMAGGDVRSGSVDAAVRRRVAQLGEDDREVLRTAAVAGLEFDIAVVAAALGRSVEDVVSAVEAAAEAALVDEVTVNRHRFAHEIVRDNLVAQLSATRRALAHQRLADGYERVAPELLSRLAHHRAEAAIDAESRRLAVRCLIAAGDAAEAVFDHDEAIRAYTRARALATGASSGDMAHLLYSLGTALVASGSRSDDTADILAEALQHAIDADLPDVVYDVWYRVAHLTSSRSTVVPPFPPDARSAADPAASARRASLETFNRYRLSMVGAEARPALDDVERIRDEVRRHGDDRAIGLIEAVYGYVLPAARARERRAAHREARERYIRGFDDPLSALIMTGAYIDALLASGDVATAVDEIAALRHDADRRRDRFLQHWGAAAMSTIALLRGHLDVAESHADDAARLAGGIEGLDASGQHGVQMFSIRREQGRLHEIAPVLRTLVRLDPTMAGAWRPGLAAAYAELEMVAEAAAELDRIVTEDAVDLPDDERLVLSASYLADATVALEDRVRAATLYELFRSWHDINVTLELIACYGPAQRYLGMLAFTLGDLAAATTHLSDSLRRCHAMGARTYEAHTHYWLGRVAQQDGRPDNASHHLRHALDLATTIGMHALARRARQALG